MSCLRCMFTAVVVIFLIEWVGGELLKPILYWAPVGGPICRDGRCG